MSAETLERSVLEAKDREQLVAIAQALGIKSVSRAKKADLIGKILEQTGSRHAGAGADSAAPTPSGPTPPVPDDRRRAIATDQPDLFGGEPAGDPGSAVAGEATRRPATVVGDPPDRLPRSCSGPTASRWPSGRSPSSRDGGQLDVPERRR